MLVLALISALVVADTTAGNPHLFAGLAGTWSCSTAAGSSVIQRYSVAPNGDVTERIDWTNPRMSGGSGDQVFSYDASSGAWSVKNTGSIGLIFTGTIRDVDGNVADIVGTQTDGKTTVPTRERFIFESPSFFSHVWEVQGSDGGWRPISYAECSLAETVRQ
ncbi:MAG TPA: hypothetical protein VMB20_15395 [Candidatus Acidoferrum sp.]|nr:hypothetical protein [Candidatus Acidoferrum sp.]